MIQHIITDLCHHLEIGIDGNLDIGNKRVIVGTPTITLVDNVFIISCDTVGVNIYYTLDGSTPTANSIRYTSAVTLSNNCTIKAIVIKGNKYSAIVEETYVKPITYLTQWKMLGNSEVHGTEIWSCGEYNITDGKYHILVQPQGGNIADIALDEPLRKVNNVADSIEFANNTAVVTRNIASTKWNDLEVRYELSGTMRYARFYTTTLKGILFVPTTADMRVSSCLSADFIQDTDPVERAEVVDVCMCTYKYGSAGVYLYIRDTNTTSVEDFYEKYGTHKFLYRLDTPTTETIEVPQIAEAESYTCVISQGGKAVSWSSFTTNPN